MNIDAGSLQVIATVLAPVGTYCGGLLQGWLKTRAERGKAAAHAAELERERHKNSAFRQQHEADVKEIAELRKANEKLRQLRHIAQEKVPEGERPYFADTGLGTPDLTPRAKR